MTRCLLTLLCCGGLLTAMAQTNPNPNSALDATIMDEMATEHFPGVSTVIVKGNAIVWLESYSYADVAANKPVEDTTVFLLASVSKLFTGTAMMQLYEDGSVDLDADINQHLPFGVDIPGHVSDSITIRQLMTHTSSIDDNGPVMDTYYGYPDPTISLADCMQRYFSAGGADYSTDNFLSAAPGTAYSYSNMATALNGYLVERVSTMPFNQYCGANIFEPLCMEKTAWFMAEFDSNQVARPYVYQGGNYVAQPHYGFADYPDGQLRSNVVDLANFMIAYLNNGSIGSNQLLTGSSVNEMLTPQVPSLESTQGLNWYQEEIYHGSSSTWLWGHNGGETGATTELYLDPANDIGIAVLANGEGEALYICDALYEYALTLNPQTGLVPNCGGVTAITEIQNDISIYPNPTKGWLTIKVPETHSQLNLELYNAQGKIVKQVRQVPGSSAINIGAYPPGVYYLTLTGQQLKYSKKVMLVK